MENLSLLKQPIQPAPFIRDPLSETSGNARKTITNGLKPVLESRTKRRSTPDSLDDILGPQSEGEEDDFVDDDDGAGYHDGLNGYGKRSHDLLDGLKDRDSKRRAIFSSWDPQIHEPVQPGSTPWRGDRRYLCRSYLLCPCSISTHRSKVSISLASCGPSIKIVIIPSPWSSMIASSIGTSISQIHIFTTRLA